MPSRLDQGAGQSVPRKAVDLRQQHQQDQQLGGQHAERDRGLPEQLAAHHRKKSSPTAATPKNAAAIV